MWLFSSLAAIGACVWLCWLIATWGRPKRQPAPAPRGTFYDEPAPQPKATLPAPPLKRTPTYRTRWGHLRTHWVETQKSDWEKDFDRLLT